MTDVQKHPSEQILKAASYLEEIVGRFLKSRETLPVLGKFESELESLNLMYLLIRNVEGCVQLARTDLVLLPAALTLARSAYEIAFKIMWMLDPVKPFDREARWLAHLKSEVEYYDKLIAKYEKIGVSTDGLRITRNQVESFREGVEALLPSDVKRIKSMPNLFSIMDDLKEARKYLGYIVLSQYAHGSHEATGLYRKHVGNQKELGEFIDESRWNIPLGACWYAISSSGRKILGQLGGDPNSFVDDSFGLEVQESIDSIK